MNPFSPKDLDSRYLKQDGLDQWRARLVASHQWKMESGLAAQPLTPRELETALDMHIADLEQAQIDSHLERLEAQDYEDYLEEQYGPDSDEPAECDEPTGSEHADPATPI